MAIDYGCTGPVLRGSGVDHDLRRDGEERYTEMYDGYAFEVIVQKNGHYPKDHDYPAVPREAVLGDCWHRFYVRMLEVDAVDRPGAAGDGPLQHGHRATGASRSSSPKSSPRAKPIWKPKPRAARWASTSSATARPFPGARVPAAARFCNLSVTHELCRGCLIADVPAIVGSLDIVMGEIDR